MRIGWFGGSFDPPHRGHVAVATAAADAFGLKEVLFAPVGRQALKGEAGASFADRLAMVRLACEEDRRFRASGIDAPREDGRANYTVETLAGLKAERPGVALFGVVGVDAFLQMPQWREPERLMGMAEWIVVTRPGYSAGVVEDARVHLLETVWVDVSATRLRERLGKGKMCSEWIGEPVLRYIRAHGLYGFGGVDAGVAGDNPIPSGDGYD